MSEKYIPFSERLRAKGYGDVLDRGKKLIKAFGNDDISSRALKERMAMEEELGKASSKKKTSDADALPLPKADPFIMEERVDIDPKSGDAIVRRSAVYDNGPDEYGSSYVRPTEYAYDDYGTVPDGRRGGWIDGGYRYVDEHGTIADRARANGPEQTPAYPRGGWIDGGYRYNPDAFYYDDSRYVPHPEYVDDYESANNGPGLFDTISRTADKVRYDGPEAPQYLRDKK